MAPRVSAGRGAWCAALAALCLVAAPGAARPQPTTSGQTGLVNMPDARVAEDGTWRVGLSRFDPYATLWTSLSAFARLEGSARYTRIDGLATELGPGFGDYKDKAFDLKALLLPETALAPAFAIGLQDFIGTRVLEGRFAAASKRLGDFDLTVGYGAERIGGAFGGVRYHPDWAGGFSFAAEYDANRYAEDLRAAESGADRRAGGPTWALEYRRGVFGGQLAAQEDAWGAGLYLAVPLNRREYVAKSEEPAPYFPAAAPPDGGVAPLYQRLREQGFTDIRVRLAADGKTLEAELSHPRISRVGRAVGRAARVLVFDAPPAVATIRVVYTERGLPLFTYTFHDPQVLARFYYGLASRYRLAQTVHVAYAAPGDALEGAPLADFEPDGGDLEVVAFAQGEAVKIGRSNGGDRQWALYPLNLGGFFNDPSGAFHYDVFAAGSARQRLGRGLYLNGAVRLTLLEDVSAVTQTSNSLLPHVRSDVAEYKKASRFKLGSLLLSRYLQPARRVYARLSAGIYEEMFGGAGGQLLYLPRFGDWAADLSTDWVKQREFVGDLGFRDYSTVTALLAVHWRVAPLGLTATVRTGRFLARDNGVRFELKRRFRSGVEAGAWYTMTDGNDITTPGSPDNPYRDKGLFVSIPLAAMLSADRRNRAGLALAPWSRDVGQMVDNPDDLYTIFERSLTWASDEYSPLSEMNE